MSLRKAVPVVDSLSGMPHKLGFPARACYAGQSWRWDGVSFRVLHPVKGRVYKRNNHSCVLLISNPGGRLLLTGDIHRKVEKRLVRQLGNALEADILVVPHHGSRTSSATAFIDTVKPSIAIVTTGYRNRFGHPKPDIRERYLDRGIRWLDTVSSGAISILMHPQTGAGPVRQFRPASGSFRNHRIANWNGSTKAH
jgi:competence protein ComEC